MNLAFSDVDFLSQALTHWYLEKDSTLMDKYPQNCLKRIWRGEHFSWWLTSLLHKFPDEDLFQQRLQLAELNYVCSSRAASTALAENYVGYGFP